MTWLRPVGSTPVRSRSPIEDVALEREVTEVTEPFRRRGAHIVISGTQSRVAADRLRLRQVLRNLVSNACKYGRRLIEIRIEDRGATVAVAVVDDGPGVPEELVDQLFSRYVHEGGTALLKGSVGLGLSIARSLTIEMGGLLSYERVAEMSVFEVVLPAVGAPTPRYLALDATPAG